MPCAVHLTPLESYSVAFHCSLGLKFESHTVLISG